jgi:hypothetical protein
MSGKIVDNYGAGLVKEGLLAQTVERYGFEHQPPLIEGYVIEIDQS